MPQTRKPKKWLNMAKTKSMTDNDVNHFLIKFKKNPLKSKTKKKGWPKGKKRGPRKDNHEAHLKAHSDLLKKYPLNDPRMDFKVLLISIAKMILTYFKK